MVRIGQNQMNHCRGLGYVDRYIDNSHAEF